VVHAVLRGRTPYGKGYYPVHLSSYIVILLPLIVNKKSVIISKSDETTERGALMRPVAVIVIWILVAMIVFFLTVTLVGLFAVPTICNAAVATVHAMYGIRPVATSQNREEENK
jgi:hypothetical protein